MHYPTSNSGNIFKNSASTSNLIYFINTSALFCLSTYVQKWSNTLQDPYNETNDNGNGTLSYVGGKKDIVVNIKIRPRSPLVLVFKRVNFSGLFSGL